MGGAREENDLVANVLKGSLFPSGALRKPEAECCLRR
jgi:hypothetical protein